MAAPSQLQTALLAALGGGSQAAADVFDKKRAQAAIDRMKAEEREAEVAPFESALDRYRSKPGKVNATELPGWPTGKPIPIKIANMLVGGYDSGYPLSSLYESFSEEERKYMTPEQIKSLQASGPVGSKVAEQVSKTVSPFKGYDTKVDFGVEGEKRLGDLESAKYLLENLQDQLKSASDSSGFGTVLKEKAAQYFPEVSKNIDALRDVSDYQKNMLLTMETFLRAATGAATNPSEYETYYQFIPKISDSPKLKKEKIDRLVGRARAKALGYVIPQIQYSNMHPQKKKEMIQQLEGNVENSLRPLLLKAAQFGEPAVSQPTQNQTGQQPPLSPALQEAMRKQDEIAARLEQMRQRRAKELGGK